MVLASRNAATGGSAQPKKVKVRVKEKERRMVPLARRGRAAGGGRKTTHGRGAGLLQLHSLVSYLLLLQRETKQAPPRLSQQARPTDAISGAQTFGDANPPTSTSHGHGR